MMTNANTNATKVTKLQKYEMLRNWMQEFTIADIELSEEQTAEITMLIEFVDREMELLLNKKNRASDKPTKTQAANEGIKEQILETLAAGRMTAAEVGSALGISIQKASALLRQLKEENKVIRVEEKKKKVYFELPAEDAEPEYIDATELLDADEADSEELETE